MPLWRCGPPSPSACSPKDPWGTCGAALDPSGALLRSLDRAGDGEFYLGCDRIGAVPVDVTSDVVIDRDRVTVSAYATDPSNAPSWYANIEAVEWKTSPPACIGSRVAFVARFLGRQLSYTYEFVELVDGERLVMRTQEGPFPMETT